MTAAQQTGTGPSEIGDLIRTPVATLEKVGQFVLLTTRTISWMIRPPYRLGQLLSAMDFVGVQ